MPSIMQDRKQCGASADMHLTHGRPLELPPEGQQGPRLRRCALQQLSCGQALIMVSSAGVPQLPLHVNLHNQQQPLKVSCSRAQAVQANTTGCRH